MVAPYGQYADGAHHVAENDSRLAERASFEGHHHQQINI